MENIWLDELQDLLQFTALAHAAVAGGHVQLLKYLITECGVDVSGIDFINSDQLGYAIDIAAYHGDLDMIKFLHDSGSQACSNSSMDQPEKNISKLSNGYMKIEQKDELQLQ
ncbi:hypothetical protein THRCLA_21130 [Thraustotheca clavata]|uniref:Uncharacterized protein n=1 Tax=Thraustotheca clavata TaxID=74557 RepID=A0A1W0A0M1_9STRA|nr:hypothetical protein THRCLA_21130 [Thraustotheca clavata]